jgi:uncharacterized membrane protein
MTDEPHSGDLLDRHVSHRVSVSQYSLVVSAAIATPMNRSITTFDSARVQAASQRRIEFDRLAELPLIVAVAEPFCVDLAIAVFQAADPAF